MSAFPLPFRWLRLSVAIRCQAVVGRIVAIRSQAVVGRIVAIRSQAVVARE